MTRKPAPPKIPKPKTATADDVRRTVVQECLMVLQKRRKALLLESDEVFFHGKLNARVEEIQEVEKEVVKLFPQST